MEKVQKGFVLPLLLIIATLIIGTGIYVYTKNKQSSQANTVMQTQISQSTSTITTNPKDNKGLITVINSSKATGSVTGYPMTIYKALSQSEVATRIAEYNQRNGIDVSAHLNKDPYWREEFDKFGFATYVPVPVGLILPDNFQFKQGDHLMTEINYSSIDQNKLIQFITKNQDFFGIDNINDFQSELPPPSGAYTIFAAEQKISKYPSYNNVSDGIASARSYLQSPEDYIYISGHFWPHANLSQNPTLSTDDVAALFVGQEYTYPVMPCDPAGPGSCSENKLTGTKVKIKKDDLDIKLMSSLYLKDSNTLELRLIYIVNLKLAGGWSEIIDAVTGEKLTS